MESKWRFFTGLIAVSLITALFIGLHPILIPQWKIALEQPNTFKPPWLSLGVNDFRFYVWHFLYDFEMQRVWVLFAILLSFGGLNREHMHGSIAFTLALPVKRSTWVASRIIVALAESLIIGIMPALLISLGALYYDLPYPIEQGIAHSLLMIIVGSIFIIVANLLTMIIRSSYYVSLSLILLILGLPYLILQEYAREITHDSLAYKFDIAHIMSGPWLLTWSNTPWTNMTVILIVSMLVFKLTIHYVKRVDY
jgi:ABC-type transport system involved in multi-copper enzyme maturation permease subunit